VKLGYGNYGMKDLDMFEALPRLREIGYEAIELCVSPGWPTAPDQLDASARKRLATLCQSLGYLPPVLLGLPQSDAAEDGLRSACEVACDLDFGDGPAVVTTMPAGNHGDWETVKGAILEDLLAWAGIVQGYNVILAIEPHVGAPVDTPEKADWLMREAAHPHVKLNFDYSHFHVQGIDLQESVDLCMPHTAHIHIKDGRMVDGEVEFLLPGAGSLDLEAFMRAIAATGTNIPITVEVSGMVWNAEGYDPWEAAEFSFRALDKARAAVQV